MRKPVLLVVEDDPDILDALSDLLELEGYDVDRARHGAEAMVALDRRRPDAIVLDLMMPVMDGMSFVTALRTRPESSVPVIVVTAVSGLPANVSTDVAAVVRKPFDSDVLLEQLRACTRNAA